MITSKDFAVTLIFIWLALVVWLVSPGCMLLQQEPSSIIQKADMYHDIVNIIVTDPEINTLLTPEQLADIHNIEMSYRVIRKMAIDIEESQAIVRTMTQCGLDICEILDELDVDNEKSREIASLRISLKIFMATLVEPPKRPAKPATPTVVAPAEVVE